MLNLTTRVALCAAILGAVLASDVQAQWTVESLSQSRGGLGAVSVDGKAIFAGGSNGLVPTDLVDIYDEATDTWSTSALSTPRAGPAAAAVGDYAIFAGGWDVNQDASAIVDILHVPTMTWTVTTLSVPRWFMGATTVGNQAIFAGGYTGNIFSPIFSDVIDIYDADLGTWSTATLSEARTQPAATTVGDLAIFAGGVTVAGYTDAVDIYDDSTGLWSTAQLSVPRLVGVQSAVTVGTRAYFAGGFDHTQAVPVFDVIDIYDAQTDEWTTDTLSVARSFSATAAVGNTILFAGGNALAGVTDLVDVFDAGTGTWLPATALSLARGGIVRTDVNGKAFFAGGNAGGGSITPIVDVYEPIASGPWTGLGYALPGVNGDPILLGSGALTTGSAGSLTLSNAAGPGAPAILFVSLSSTPTPFKGGTLATVPVLIALGFSTLGSPGGVTLPWNSVPAGLSGASLYFQCGIQDAGAMQGVALSNALRADVP